MAAICAACHHSKARTSQKLRDSCCFRLLSQTEATLSVFVPLWAGIGERSRCGRHHTPLFQGGHMKRIAEASTLCSAHPLAVEVLVMDKEWCESGIAL